MGIVIAILIFGLIVVWHEFGHFILAKLNHVQVNEFMIGLGPRLVGVQRGETMFSIHLLPFGGACAMEGEDSASENERAFTNKKLWQRALIVFAGPFFNLIMAFIVSIILLSLTGVDRPVISGVMEGYPAEAAGMQSGDEIVKLNGMNIHFYREIPVYLRLHSGEDIEVTYERDGERYQTLISPQENPEDGRSLIGIYYEEKYEKLGPLKTLEYSFHEVGYQVWTVLSSLKMLVQGKFSLNDLSGPVGIVKVVGDTYNESLENGGAFAVLVNMLNMIVLLSANLAVMNLLPIPGLDGGRLLFLLVELIIRKKIPPEKEGIINVIGVVILLVLMGVVLFNDIRKIVTGGL